jgi:hypothetical protein
MAVAHWSPDGSELIVISIRPIWGAGTFWRVAARPGGGTREIRTRRLRGRRGPTGAATGGAWSIARTLAASGTSSGS